jgi:hypothetical protein
VSEPVDRPEHIDLAKLVAVRRLLQAALDGLTERPSQSAMVAAQDALRQMPVVNSDGLWESLQAAARRTEQPMIGEAPTDLQRQAAAWRLVEDVLASAEGDQLADDVQRVIQADQASRVIPVVRVQVEAFVTTAEEFAAQEVPPTDNQEACAAWVKAAKVILEKAIDLLTNVAVAAAFTVTAVQLAAQRTVLGAAELTERTVSQIGPAVPLLVGITTLAAEAAIGVKMIRDIWQPSDPAGRPDTVGQPRQVDAAEAMAAGDPRQQERRAAFSAAIDEQLDHQEPGTEPLGPAGESTRQAVEPDRTGDFLRDPARINRRSDLDGPGRDLEELGADFERRMNQRPRPAPPPSPGSPAP